MLIIISEKGGGSSLYLLSLYRKRGGGNFLHMKSISALVEKGKKKEGEKRPWGEEPCLSPFYEEGEGGKEVHFSSFLDGEKGRRNNNSYYVVIKEDLLHPERKGENENLLHSSEKGRGLLIPG